jgi:serine/threonine protein kinase
LLENRYRVGRPLGAGGFGITYLGYDTRLSARVAVKEFFPSHLYEQGLRRSLANPLWVEVPPRIGAAAFQEERDKIIREACRAVTIHHGNVVRVRDAFAEQLADATVAPGSSLEGAGYLVMDYVAGRTLDEYVRERGGGPLSERDSLRIITSVLDGLEAIHDAGLLHRDLKPSNLYIRAQNDQPLILDLGAAREIGTASVSGATKMWTPGYAPPEQYDARTRGARPGEEGPWTDLYACGAILHYLLTGQELTESVRRAEGDRVPLAGGNSELVSAVRWAVELDPSRRPASVRQWRAALLATQRGEETPTAMPADVTRAFPQQARYDAPQGATWPVSDMDLGRQELPPAMASRIPPDRDTLTSWSDDAAHSQARRPYMRSHAEPGARAAFAADPGRQQSPHSPVEPPAALPSRKGPMLLLLLTVVGFAAVALRSPPDPVSTSATSGDTASSFVPNEEALVAVPDTASIPAAVTDEPAEEDVETRVMRIRARWLQILADSTRYGVRTCDRNVESTALSTRAYYNGGAPVMIRDWTRDGEGNLLTREFFFEPGANGQMQLMFAFYVYATDGRSEHRYYFHNGELIRWRGPDGALREVGSEDARVQAQAVLEEAATLEATVPCGE